VSEQILRQVGVPAFAHGKTSGVGGVVPVALHRVGLHLADASDATLPWITFLTLEVIALPPTIPFDVLIGLDVIRTCRLFVDGPGGTFTLDQ
jgi:hypothetical protein